MCPVFCYTGANCQHGGSADDIHYGSIHFYVYGLNKADLNLKEFKSHQRASFPSAFHPNPWMQEGLNQRARRWWHSFTLSGRYNFTMLSLFLSFSVKEISSAVDLLWFSPKKMGTSLVGGRDLNLTKVWLKLVSGVTDCPRNFSSLFNSLSPC